MPSGWRATSWATTASAWSWATTSCTDRALADVADSFEKGSYGAGCLLYQVGDPQRFGVAELDGDGEVVAFEEKPRVPKSDVIPIGVYFLRPDAFEVIAGLRPSARGELEITELLNHYVSAGAFMAPPLRGRVV